MCIRDRSYIGQTLVNGGFGAPDADDGGGDPVSYTHLDVYKRQFLTLTSLWEARG